MKLISASAFLLVASSAAADNNNVRNLKKRVLEDTMSMPATEAEEESDPDKQHWWPYPSPTPPSPAPGCNGIPPTACEGREYLKLVTGAELGLTPFPGELHIAWTKFYDATPEGCVLAPIDTTEDLLKAQAAVAPREINAWVGLFKEAVDVCGGPTDIGNCSGSVANSNSGDWKNLDGTFSTVANLQVPNDIWRSNEPNNFPPVQQYVHLFYSESWRLRDENDQGGAPTRVDAAVTAAVYKCCGSTPLVTFPSCP